MVSLTLKVILHVAKNDSKCREVAPLKSCKKLLLGYYEETGGKVGKKLTCAQRPPGCTAGPVLFCSGDTFALSFPSATS